jgi:hypothetical protein
MKNIFENKIIKLNSSIIVAEFLINFDSILEFFYPKILLISVCQQYNQNHPYFKFYLEFLIYLF